MDAPRRVSVVAVVAVVLAFLLPASYVTGYFALSKNTPGATPEHRCRVFRQKWLTTAYKPAAKIESAMTGDTVSTYWMP